VCSSASCTRNGRALLINRDVSAGLAIVGIGLVKLVRGSRHRTWRSPHDDDSHDVDDVVPPSTLATVNDLNDAMLAADALVTLQAVNQ
jgi:hypothetical protein